MDVNVWHYYVLLPAIGFSFFYILHVFIRRLLRLFRGLSEPDIYVISCRLVSAIQAILASTVGIIIASSCRNNIMTDVRHSEEIVAFLQMALIYVSSCMYRHWLTNAYVCFALPYLPYDTWAMYAYNIRTYEHVYLKKSTWERIRTFIKHNKIMAIHHVIIPVILAPIILLLRNDRGDFFFGIFYMIELVVPFISAREILLQLKMKDSSLFVFTSLAMVVVFFICRIAVFPYLYSAYAGFSGQSMFKVPFIIPIKCNVGCLIILLPQVYWFYLMVKGLCRFLSKTGSKSQHNAAWNGGKNS